jgi:hypothetical protein
MRGLLRYGLEHWNDFWRKVPATDRERFLPIGILILALVLSLGFKFLILNPVALDRKSAVVKANLHAIQLAVERFAVDNEGTYPPRAIDVLSAGYMDSFPLNPFRGMPMLEHELFSASLPEPGDFVYWPIYDGEEIDAYMIVTGRDSVLELRANYQGYSRHYAGHLRLSPNGAGTLSRQQRLYPAEIQSLLMKQSRNEQLTLEEASMLSNYTGSSRGSR